MTSVTRHFQTLRSPLLFWLTKTVLRRRFSGTSFDSVFVLPFLLQTYLFHFCGFTQCFRLGLLGSGDLNRPIVFALNLAPKSPSRIRCRVLCR